MSDYHNKPLFNDQEVDLAVFFSILKDFKKLIIIITTIFAILSVIIALSIPNVYRSQVVLASVDSHKDSRLTSSLGNLGGLASLAGINLPGSGGSKKNEALAILQSNEFTENFILERNILVPLMAAEGWDKATNQFKINPKIYDVKSQKWVTGLNKPSSPSLQKAVRNFRTISSVANDIQTGFVTLHVDSYSPNAAKEWVDWLVQDINERMRVDEVSRATKSLEYLNEQMSKTTIAEIKYVLSELIKSETQIIMLSKSSPEYMFKTLDPAIAPELKLKPRRSIICIITTIGGFIFSIFLTLFVYYRNPNWATRLK